MIHRLEQSQVPYLVRRTLGDVSPIPFHRHGQPGVAQRNQAGEEHSQAYNEPDNDVVC